MNILYYTHFSPYGNNRVGGAEMSIKSIAEMMAEKGHHSVFVTRGKRRFFGYTDKKTINKVHIYTINKIWIPGFRIPILKKWNKYINDWFFDYKIGQILKKHTISIVHAHYQLRTCLYFLKLRERKNYPYKFVMRFAGMLWYESLKKKPELYESYKYIFEESDMVNFVSEGLYQLYKSTCQREQYNFYIKNYFIQDIGTQIKRLQPKPFKNDSKNSFKLVMATRFTNYQKRQDILVEAVSKLKNELPIELFLIGSGPNSENIQKLIENLNINDRVKIIPFLPQQELWEFLKSADILCHACEYEGSSKIIIECMGMGLPVIVSNVLPLNDYVQEGVTGFLADNTPESWADKIKQVYYGKNELPEIAKNAKSFILDHYDAEKNVVRYVEQFKNLHTVS